MTTDGKYNLQLRASEGARESPVKRIVSRTVAAILVGRDEEVMGEQVRQRLLDAREIACI